MSQTKAPSPATFSLDDIVIYNGRPHSRYYAQFDMKAAGVPRPMADKALAESTVLFWSDKQKRYPKGDPSGKGGKFMPKEESGGTDAAEAASVGRTTAPDSSASGGGSSSGSVDSGSGSGSGSSGGGGYSSNSEHTTRIVGETTVKPPTGIEPYHPDPQNDSNGDGITDEARVGVPASSVPPPPTVPRLPRLTADERLVEERFVNQYERDPDGVATAYRKKVMAGEIGDGPNVFNTDDAKLLSGDYNPQGVSKDEVMDARSRYNVTVHQTANAIAKRAFLQYLDEQVAALPKERRTVFVTSGGVASGKGFALSAVKTIRKLSAKVGAVWDAAGEQNATENPWIMAECEKRGIRPIFAFVHADPTKTWESPDRGVVERAQKKGRMVDARVFADSYAIGAKNFKTFMDAVKPTGKADFIIVDNDRPPTKQPIRVATFPKKALALDAETLYRRSSAILDTLDHLKPSVRRGGSIGRRVWGPPKD